MNCSRRSANSRKAILTVLSVIAVFVVFLSPPVFADSLGDFYYVAEDGEITITGYRVTGPTAVIPAQIEGMPVTRIASGAFVECPGLFSLQIPASVKEISETTFGYGLWSYTSGLAKMESIWVDPKNPYYTSVDGVLFNKDMTRLIRYPISKQGEYYQVPKTVTAIAESAFLNCDYLVQAILPIRLQSIGDYAFSGCKSMTRMDVRDLVTDIGQGAFANCTSLYSLYLPNLLKNISDNLCLNCTNLELLYIPDRVETIGAYAFSQCRTIQAIRIPDGVTSIGAFAFSNCRQLEQIKIPAGVTYLGDGAFSDCQRLKEITIPSGIEQIRAYAFARCFELDYVHISEGIRQIGDQAFFNCKSLTKVILPDTIEFVGTQAFSYCSGLRSIRLSPAMTTLSLKALAWCDSLEHLEIPAQLSLIEAEALHGLKALTRIDVDPNNPTYASRDGVLYDKRENILIKYPASAAARHFEIPDGVTTIRSKAFHQANNLQRVTIPASVEWIESEAFRFCEQLEQAHFLGNAPEMFASSFKYGPDGFTLYYQNGRTGFEELGYPVRTLNTGGLSVTFCDWEGTVLHATVVDYGQSASPPADPVREGYQFVGWDKPTSAVYENLTVSALYTALDPPEKNNRGSYIWIGAVFLSLSAALLILFFIKKGRQNTSP